MAARPFVLEGRVRILFGMTIPEIAVLLGSMVMFNTALPHFASIIFGLMAGRFAIMGLRFVERKLPPRAFLHVRTWLTEADSYEPLADPEPLPLVHREDLYETSTQARQDV